MCVDKCVYRLRNSITKYIKLFFYFLYFFIFRKGNINVTFCDIKNFIGVVFIFLYYSFVIYLLLISLIYLFFFCLFIYQELLRYSLRNMAQNSCFYHTILDMIFILKTIFIYILYYYFFFFVTFLFIYKTFTYILEVITLICNILFN